MPARGSWLAAWALCACGCAAIWPVPSAQIEGRPVLTGIEFTGNHGISSKELRSKIATEATSGTFRKTPRYLDEDLFAIDEKRIERHYQAKGYFLARVEGREILRDARGRVWLRVKIAEGARALISNFSVAGLEALDARERDEVLGKAGLSAGDGFDETVYEKAKDKVLLALRERGFAEARVEGRVEVFRQEGRAQIAMRADLGLRYRFGKISVTGNHLVPGEVIARASGIGKGDVYRPSSLELAQQRVYNLGTFSAARVGLEPLPGGVPVAPVRINVREAPFQTVRAGVGAQVETQRYVIPRLRAEYVNRNLFGPVRHLELTRLELGVTGGWAFIPSVFERSKSGLVLASSAQLTVPSVILPGLDFISRGEYARDVQVSFDYQRVAARFSLLYRRGKHSVSPSLNLVRYYDVNVPAAERESGILSGGNSPSLLRDSCEKACLLTYPELRYTFDARDSVLEPTRGVFFTIDLQQSLRPGSFTYFKIEPDLRGYLSLGGSVVLAARANWGAILLPAGEKSPATERFFAGGANSNRGYGASRQGPKLGGNPTGFQPTGDPLDQRGGTYTSAVPAGGNGLFLVSGEVRVRTDFILKNLAVVGFVDASRVTSRWQFPWEARLEVAPGLGLRYITPFGPVRFDVAVLVNPADEVAFNRELTVMAPLITQPTRVSVSCAAAGCIREGRTAFHLTLGEAF